MIESQAQSLRGARVVILDADGVLRRLPDGEALEGLGAFEAFLRQPRFQDVLVVAAGEWKRHLPIRGIRRLFSEDIAARIVGATPEVKNTDKFQSHVEILEWLREHPEIEEYAVVEYSGYALNSPAVESGAFVVTGEVFSEAHYEGLARLLGPSPSGSTRTQ
jgi:hypothetical protein